MSSGNYVIILSYYGAIRLVILGIFNLKRNVYNRSLILDILILGIDINLDI